VGVLVAGSAWQLVSVLAPVPADALALALALGDALADLLAFGEGLVLVDALALGEALADLLAFGEALVLVDALAFGEALALGEAAAARSPPAWAVPGRPASTPRISKPPPSTLSSATRTRASRMRIALPAVIIRVTVCSSWVRRRLADGWA
jgi:hypothetical protein